jgi:hypothetical protein
MYILKFVGDIAWIARNLQNMEDSIFGPKPARHINLDSSDSDVVDTNDNTLSIIKTSDVETVKLSRKKNCNKLNRNDLIKLLNYITLKLPSDFRSQFLQDVNDNATDKLIKSYVSITNDNGKAPAIYSSAMTIHSKMSLHAFGSGSTGYSRIWRNNIEFFVLE